MKRNLDSFLFAAMLLLCPAALAIKAAPGNENARARTHAAASQHSPHQASQQVPPNLAEFDTQVAHIADKLRQMRQQIDSVEHARDNQDRLRLLQEHWKVLQASMDDLQKLWGPGMMGCCGSAPPAEERMSEREKSGQINGPKNGSATGPTNEPTTEPANGTMMGGRMNWRSASGYYASLTAEQIRQRQYLTDQYLALQQQIMRQWMLHQHWLYQIQTQTPARAR